jgi:hypothetical protein
MNRETAERCTILRGLVGSTVHGLNVNGIEDRDEMGICVAASAQELTDPAISPLEQPGRRWTWPLQKRSLCPMCSRATLW